MPFFLFTFGAMIYRALCLGEWRYIMAAIFIGAMSLSLK